MGDQFKKDGPLELVWLAGREELTDTVKGRKSKHYKRVWAVNIVDLCAGVKAVAIVPSSSKSLGLQKMAVLMYGLAVLSEMKLDKLLKIMEGLLGRITTMDLPPTIDVPKTGRGIRTPRGRGGDAGGGATDLTVAFGECDYPGYFETYDPSDIRQAVGGLHTTVSSPQIQDQTDEEDEVVPSGTRRRRRDRIQPSRREENLPNEDSILAMLRNTASHLDPRAYTMIEVDLPPLPPVDDEGMEFGDFPVPFVFPRDMPGNLEALESSVDMDEEDLEDLFRRRQAAEMSPPRTAGVPQIPPRPRRLLPFGREEGDGSFELSSIDPSQLSTHVPARRSGRRLIFEEPGSTEISDAEMRRQCEPFPMSEDTAGEIQRGMKPILIKIGIELFQRHQRKPTLQGIREVRHRLMKGIMFINNTGRRIVSRELMNTLDNIPLPMVIDTQTQTQDANERARQLMINISALQRSGVRRGAVATSLGPADAEQGPMTSATAANIPMDDIPEEAENIPPEPEPELVDLEPPMPPNLMEYFQQASASPTLTRERTTFHTLCPPGSSRSAASHMFASLLRMQKNKMIMMEQLEPFGTIYIDTLPTGNH